MPKAFPKKFREDVIRVYKDSDTPNELWQGSPRRVLYNGRLGFPAQPASNVAV